MNDLMDESAFLNKSLELMIPLHLLVATCWCNDVIDTIFI